MPNPRERYQGKPAEEQGPWSRYQPLPSQAQAQPEPTLFQKIVGQTKRQAGLGGRMLAEGVVDVFSPFADAAASIANLGLAGYDKLAGNAQPSYRFPEQSAYFSQQLTQAGVPAPGSGVENAANIFGRFVTSAAANAPLTTAVMARLGFPAATPAPPKNVAQIAAKGEAAQTLQKAGVPLDKSQAQGGRFMQMLRSAVTDHPYTAERQAEFAKTQQKAFNRAVLRSIGENADEATQSVMSSAKNRIGSVFNDIGKSGVTFDDALQADIASVVDDATRTVPQSELSPLSKNVDDLLNAIDDSGKINGDVFNRVRSRLGVLSRRQGIGQAARKLENAMLDALERTSPGQKAKLADARDQYRNLKLIEPAIAKGTDRNISPKLLANRIGGSANANMGIYGVGGDQGLVKLAQAGKDVIPEVLPNSGTNPRGLATAPLRAISSAPLYKAGQAYLLSQPSPAGPPSPIINALAPSAPIAARNALLQYLTGETEQ